MFHFSLCPFIEFENHVTRPVCECITLFVRDAETKSGVSQHHPSEETLLCEQFITVLM